MNRVTIDEVVRQHAHAINPDGSKKIVLISIGAWLALPPPQPINPRTGLHYGEKTLTNIKWRHSVNDHNNRPKNTSAFVMSSGPGKDGIQTNTYTEIKYHRETLSRMVRNVKIGGEALEIHVKTPKVIDSAFIKWLRDKVADLLVAVPEEIELVLKEGIAPSQFAKMKSIEVKPAGPISLLYADDPKPVTIKLLHS